MGLLETASGNSIWRGMNYYEDHKVISWEKSGKYTYDGIVAGSERRTYTVHVDTDHPKRSTCNCAFANGRRVVCKHMIALYFTAEPETLEKFMNRVAAWEQEEEERREQHLAELRRYINSLSKAELRERLYDALIDLEDRNSRYW